MRARLDFTPFTSLPFVTPYVPWLAVLASCSAPPALPTPDGSKRQAINSPMAVDLQVCRTDLGNTRLQLTESERLTQHVTTDLANLQARHKLLGAMHTAVDQQQQGNGIVQLHFEFGSTRVVVPSHLAAELVARAKASPLVVVRGRTDGVVDTLAESRVARERAAAMRDYLVAAGVDPARIRTTYQPIGDHVADNTSARGRDLNRRVEIEFYRNQPIALAADTAARR